MESWVAVGAQCVCVIDFSPALARLPAWLDGLVHRMPMPGEVLTIATFGPGGDGHATLTFVEIPARVRDEPHIVDVSWTAEGFRPLVRHTLESDVALFKALPMGVPA